VKAKRGARRPDVDTLYAINADGSHNKIHMADVKGRFQNRKKVLWALMIGLYLVLPWIKIGGNPAILIDLPARHFYLFGQTFNAQDFKLAFFFITGLAFTLFVVSALWGRLWCGYACPHTVFLEGVYRRIERFFEGDAGKRKRLAAMPWNREKVLRRGGKWLVFLGVSLILSHTFLSYFMPVEDVFSAITSPPSEHMTAFVFIVVFTAIIYFNFTWFREQLCIVICPYGRLQGVLYDQDTVNVAYDHVRGEPRGHYTKAQRTTSGVLATEVSASAGSRPAASLPTEGHAEEQPEVAERGSCIDCYRCVSVCPTGIDIRNGTQLECVGCANCIDACDAVMDKIGQPRGLIRYDSLRGVETGQRRFVRPRLFVYAVLLVIGVSVFSIAAFGRSSFEANLLRLPGAAYVVEGDQVRNSFQLHLYNKRPETAELVIEPVPQDGVSFQIAGDRQQLDSLADRKITLMVSVTRALFEKGMEAQVRVSVGDEVETVDIPLVGPFQRSK